MGFDFNQGIFTKGILLLLALTFVIGFGYVGGIDLGGGGTGGGTAVKVNGEKVTYAQFKNLQDALRRQYTQNMDEVPPEIQDFIKFSALNNIIELKLLSQKANELGFRVTKDELASAITTNPAFQVDGVFVGKENYSTFITRRLNQTVADFEQSYKEELLAKKLISIINESAKVTDEELLNLYKMQNEELNLNYVTFSPDDFLSSVTPDEQEIKDYYEKNKSSFLGEEKRKIEYTPVSVDSFIPNIEVSDEQLKAYYDAYTDEFKEDEKLLSYEEVKPRIEAKLTSKRAENAYNEFVSDFSGKDINNLDELAVVSGPDKIMTSPFFAQGEENNTEIPAKAAQRAFTLDKGEIALISENASSWLIKVKEIQQPMQKELSEVKEEIIRVLKEEKAENAAKVSAEETLKKFENTNQSFTQTANDLGLDVKKTDFFNRLDGPVEINSEDLNIDAFQVRENDPLIRNVYNSNGNYYITSLNEKKEINREQFEENKFSVKEREISRQKRELLKSWIEDMRSEAKIVPNKNLFPAQG